MINNFMDELKQQVQYVCDALRIEGYRINCALDNRYVVNSQSNAGAVIEIDHAYLDITLTFTDDVEDKRTLFKYVVHELIHAKMAPSDSFHQFTRQMIPKKHRKLFDEMYRIQDEQITVGFERLLVDDLWEGYCDEYDLDEG